MMRKRLDRFAPQGSMRRMLASSVAWTTLGAAISRIAVLFAAVLMARMLGKDGYGQWGIIESTISVFAQYAAMGIGKTITRHVAELKVADPVRAGRVLSFLMTLSTIGLIVTSLVCVAISPYLARHVYHEPSLMVPLMCGAFLLITMTATSLSQGALAGFNDYRSMAKASGAQGIALPVLAVLLIYPLGLTGAVIAAGCSFALALVVSQRQLHRLYHRAGIVVRWGTGWSERSMFWNWCVPMALSGGVAVPATWFVYTYASQLLGFGALGGYMAAERFRGILLFIPGTIKQVTLPMLSEARSRGNRRRFVRVLWANVLVNIGIATLGAIPVMVLSPWLMAGFGPQFRHEWPTLVVLASAAILQSATNIIGQVTTVAGRTWLNLLFSSWFAVVFVVVGVVGVNWWGSIGLAVAVLAAQGAHLVSHGSLAWALVRSGRMFEEPADIVPTGAASTSAAGAAIMG